jgi:flavin reductase (DIM6/NTAB) family NADH-FMN oxidoreductase RutF
MKIFSDNLGPIHPYKLITGCVVPRPIAWITTLNENGKVNLAPYSNFTFLSHRSLMVAVGIAHKPPEYTVMKDTERNIRRTGEFVIHIGSVKHIGQIQDSSYDYDADVSEVEELGIKTVPCDIVKVPRIADVKIAMECTPKQYIDVGSPGYVLIAAEVRVFHIDDDVFSHNGRIDSAKLDPAVRIGGPNYAQLGQVFENEYITKGFETR